MSTATVRFSKVGRAQKTWVEKIPLINGQLDQLAMVKSIKKRKALGSRFFEFVPDPDWSRDGEIIVGVVRCVGHWEVLE